MAQEVVLSQAPLELCTSLNQFPACHRYSRWPQDTSMLCNASKWYKSPYGDGGPFTHYYQCAASLVPLAIHANETATERHAMRSNPAVGRVTAS